MGESIYSTPVSRSDPRTSVPSAKGRFNAEFIFMRTPRSFGKAPPSFRRLFTPHIRSSLQHLDQLVRCLKASRPQLRSDH